MITIGWLTDVRDKLTEYYREDAPVVFLLDQAILQAEAANAAIDAHRPESYTAMAQVTYAGLPKVIDTMARYGAEKIEITDDPAMGLFNVRWRNKPVVQGSLEMTSGQVAEPRRVLTCPRCAGLCEFKHGTLIETKE